MAESFIKVNDGWIKLVDKNVAGLNYGQLLLLCKIEALCHNDNKCCTSTNDYFEYILRTSVRNIQKYLDVLESKCLIKRFEKRIGLEKTVRFIYVQYDKINELLSIEISKTRYEIKGELLEADSTRTNECDHMNKCVIPHEQMGDTTRTNGHPNKILKDKEKILEDTNSNSANADSFKEKNSKLSAEIEISNFLKDKYYSEKNQFYENCKYLEIPTKIIDMTLDEKSRLKDLFENPVDTKSELMYPDESEMRAEEYSMMYYAYSDGMTIERMAKQFNKSVDYVKDFVMDSFKIKEEDLRFERNSVVEEETKRDKFASEYKKPKIEVDREYVGENEDGLPICKIIYNDGSVEEWCVPFA